MRKQSALLFVLGVYLTATVRADVPVDPVRKTAPRIVEAPSAKVALPATVGKQLPLDAVRVEIRDEGDTLRLIVPAKQLAADCNNGNDKTATATAKLFLLLPRLLG